MSQLLSVKGNLLHAESEALVNAVNCVGVMGKGLALAFKKAYPDNFEAYAKACRRGWIGPGRIFVFERAPGLAGPRFILNFPTKRHWRNPSQLEDIQAGLVDLVRICREKNITSIAIPPLGCGLGGLDWNVVRPLIVEALSTLPDLYITLYDPPGWTPSLTSAAASPSSTGTRPQPARSARRSDYQPPF